MDANFKLEGMDLVSMNQSMETLTGLDFESGEFYCYSEIIIKDSEVSGYVEPVIRNLTLAESNSEQASLLDKAWGNIAGAIAGFFKNSQEDQIATRITISGNVSNTSVNTSQAFWNLLKNAFVEAFDMGLKHNVEYKEQN